MTSKKPAPAGSGFGLGLLSAALISVARSKGSRRRAPARDRYVDPVTETLVPRRMEGSQWRPGQMTRVRTRQGEPFKLVPLEDLEVDRTGAEYPITEAIQVGARDRLRELNRKRPKPIKRPSADDVDQREIRRILGINDSFRDGADGLAKILGSQDLGSASVDDLGDYADAKIVGDILDQFEGDRKFCTDWLYLDSNHSYLYRHKTDEIDGILYGSVGCTDRLRANFLIPRKVERIAFVFTGDANGGDYRTGVREADFMDFTIAARDNAGFAVGFDARWWYWHVILDWED